MKIKLTKIILENFKSYNGKHEVELSDISVLIGANSSGKSSVVQALLVLKQTIENTSSGWDLLLSGKYVTLGSFEEVVNSNLDEKQEFALGIGVVDYSQNNELVENKQYNIIWHFVKDINFRANTKLHKIVIENGNESLEILSNENNKFTVKSNDAISKYGIMIDSLRFNSILFEYNKEFNEIIIGYFNELLNIIFGTNKHKYTISKNQFALRQGVEILQSGIVEAYFVNRSNQEERNQEKAKKEKNKEKYDDQIKEIERFQLISKQMFDYLNSDYYSMQMDLSQEIAPLFMIRSTFSDESKLKALIELNNKYSEIFEKNKMIASTMTDSIPIKFDEAIFLLENQKHLTSKLEFSLILFYSNSIFEILKHISYVGPLRESPKGLYNYSFDTNPKYVGAKGEFFPFVLSNSDFKEKHFLPMADSEVMNLSEALDDWCNHLSIASKVKVASKNSFGVSIVVSNMMNTKADIMNVGIGTSQVLPVLISGLVSAEKDILIYEQPELHLHPYSQSRLADFFVEASNNGRQVIIESHSEYMLQRFRYHIMKNDLSNTAIKLSFFSNSFDGSEVKSGFINPFGDINYPEDFKDQTQQLINELLEVALGGGNND